MKTSIARLIGGGLALTLLVAACGDDNDDGDAATTEETGDQAATSDEGMSDEATPTESDDMSSAAGDDIVDTAVGAGDFETLVAAVQAAGWRRRARRRPLHRVRPQRRGPPGAACRNRRHPLADPQGDLTDILTYHVVEGEVLAEDVVGLDGQEVPTVNGATFTVDAGDDGSVTLRDAAGNDVGVTQTDIETSNGVIHAIDTVLIPS